MGGKAPLLQSEVSIEKLTEIKQYENGLEVVGSILKKFPQYGETLHGLELSLDGLNHKSEAYEIVRTSIKKDISNPLHWRVCAMLYWSDRQYHEAFRCQKQALKIDQSNIDILLDLSMMQVRVCDFTGFIETRWILLTLNPTSRMNWICFAVAHHFSKNVPKAIDILETYEGILGDQDPPESERYEYSEMLLYKISLLEEAGFLAQALNELRMAEDKIVSYVVDDGIRIHD